MIARGVWTLISLFGAARLADKVEPLLHARAQKPTSLGNPMTQTALVVGASGIVGSAITQSLLDHAWRVVA